MATQKNNWLNAKPVTRTGGKSGGVRKPNKPYSKSPAKPKAEPPARWDAKTKSERLQQAAKTKPSSPAPRQVLKNPVTRTGPVKGPVPPKGSTGPVTMPNSRRAGVNLPKTGARAERTATRANQLIKDARAKAASAPKPSPASTPKPSAPTASAVSRVGSGASRLAGGAARLLGAAGAAAAIPLELKAMADRQKRWDDYKARNNMGGTRPGTASGRTGRGGTTADTMRNRTSADTGRYIPGNQQVKPAASKPKPKPAATQSGGGSTQARSGGVTAPRPTSSGPSRSSAPRRQSPGPASNAGMKNQDKNYRGNVFEKTFGYKAGQAPDQQKSRFKSVDNKFGQDSGYEPKTKVDGSKYADKKPDMKKVNEYDRLRRKYYD